MKEKDRYVKNHFKINRKIEISEYYKEKNLKL